MDLAFSFFRSSQGLKKLPFLMKKNHQGNYYPENEISVNDLIVIYIRSIV